MKRAVFDPFNDFESSGYLRNYRNDKDPEIVKRFEHAYFEANIDQALEFLASCPSVTYADFLNVHHILFKDYYPWAGLDRATTSPACAVSKGHVYFSDPRDAQRAVEHGLGMGNNPQIMQQKFGEVMGLFAYGHPFLDGNGRTMLLVHIELCHRAGFSIDWHRTNKVDYLTALSNEIDKPGKGILDQYLLQYKTIITERISWESRISEIEGLNGSYDENQIGEDLSDPVVAEKYRNFERQRGYSYTGTADSNK